LVKHAFLSFVEEDLETVRMFRGQAKNKNSLLSFDDYSVKVPYNSTDAAYIRTQITGKIRAASVTICLIGPTTYKSNWVDWEVRKSAELGKKVIGVKLYSGQSCPTPKSLTDLRAPVLAWDIDAIVRAIG
jgi:hypothetical protein